MKLQPGHIKREVSWKGAILQDWRCCDAVKTYETPQKHHGNLCGLLLSCRIEISSFAALRASDAFTAMVCSILYLENWAEGWSVKTFKFTKFKQGPLDLVLPVTFLSGHDIPSIPPLPGELALQKEVVNRWNDPFIPKQNVTNSLRINPSMVAALCKIPCNLGCFSSGKNARDDLDRISTSPPENLDSNKSSHRLAYLDSVGL